MGIGDKGGYAAIERKTKKLIGQFLVDIKWETMEQSQLLWLLSCLSCLNLN